MRAAIIESDCVLDIKTCTNLIQVSMMPIDALPDDLDALRALVSCLSSERDAAIEECRRVREQNDRLHHLLRQLQRAQFGRRSERLDHEQMQLALEDIETTIAEQDAQEDKKDTAETTADAQRKKRCANRGSLPAHLPRIHVTLVPEIAACPCCHGAMHVIGEHTAERLDVIPAQYRVIVTHRPQYACRACEQGVVQTPAPERLIKGGLPTEAMVASVLVAKYAWHLPLYRQAQMLLSQGITIERATLAFWVGYAAAELKPLYLRLRELILGSTKIAVDETVAPVLDPGRGRTKKGYFWAIARDLGDHPTGVSSPYARGAVHGPKLLESDRGIVQCDGDAADKTYHARLLLGSSEKTVLRYRKGRFGADRERSSGPHRRALCDRAASARGPRRGPAHKCRRRQADRCAIPPLAGQHRIVAKVDELMALCDRNRTPTPCVLPTSNKNLLGERQAGLW